MADILMLLKNRPFLVLALMVPAVNPAAEKEKLPNVIGDQDKVQRLQQCNLDLFLQSITIKSL